MYFKKLIGKKCYLSPIDINDNAIYTEWWNDSEVVKYLPNHYVITAEKQKENLITKSKSHHYSIIDYKSNKLIGDVCFIDINQIDRSAEVSIIIGNKKYWNKGYGKEALNLLIDYGYKSLSLHCIFLKVYEKNKSAIGCYKSIGFQIAGKVRECAFYDQDYDNVVLMDLLPNDFYKIL
jgi:RimJ/RimL family protein N-acetyltransferase